jgi:hypothetical protein
MERKELPGSAGSRRYKTVLLIAGIGSICLGTLAVRSLVVSAVPTLLGIGPAGAWTGYALDVVLLAGCVLGVWNAERGLRRNLRPSPPILASLVGLVWIGIALLYYMRGAV